MTKAEFHQTISVLRRKQVEARTGLSKSGIYAAIQQGQFPRPIQISQRSVGWLESDINSWLEQRIARRVKA